MIERKFIAQNIKEFRIKEFIRGQLSRVGLSSVKLQRTSVGERIVVAASRPGLVVGRGGSTIQQLTRDLKTEFELENPQIEIEEIKDFYLDAVVVAESIVGQLERFGTQRFKGVGHRTVEKVMRSGALGVEILISGKIPSSRSRTWRFADGYMKKCGDLAITGVDTAIMDATLKTGTVGVQVRIMPASTKLPDKINFDKRERAQAAKDADQKRQAEREAKQTEKDAVKQDSKEESEKESDAAVDKPAEKTTEKTSKKSSKKSTKKAAKKTTKKSTKKSAKTAKKAEGEEQ